MASKTQKKMHLWVKDPKRGPYAWKKKVDKRESDKKSAKKAKGAPRLRPQKPLSQQDCCGYGALFYLLDTPRKMQIMIYNGEKEIAQRIKSRPNELNKDWFTWWKKKICPDRKKWELHIMEFEKIATQHGVSMINVTGHYCKHLKITTVRQLRQRAEFWNREHEEHTKHYPQYCRDRRKHKPCNFEWWALLSEGHIQVICTNKTKAQFCVYDQGGKLNEQRMLTWSNARIKKLWRLDFMHLF